MPRLHWRTQRAPRTRKHNPSYYMCFSHASTAWVSAKKRSPSSRNLRRSKQDLSTSALTWQLPAHPVKTKKRRFLIQLSMRWTSQTLRSGSMRWTWCCLSSRILYCQAVVWQVLTSTWQGRSAEGQRETWFLYIRKSILMHTPTNMWTGSVTICSHLQGTVHSKRESLRPYTRKPSKQLSDLLINIIN